MPRSLTETFLSTKKDEAERFRQRAAKCDANTSQSTDPVVRQSFEFAAEQWRFLADRADRRWSRRDEPSAET
jgi:hypothetical protein